MSIKWKTVKDDSELKLAGCTIEVERIDGAAKAAIIRDGSGGVVKIWENSWALGIAVPEPPEVKVAWAVTGKVLGIAIDEVFTTEREAVDRRDELTTGVGDEGDAKVKVAKVKLVDGKRVEAEKDEEFDVPAF